MEEYKTIVYVALPISNVETLDKLAEKRKCSRADLVREAVANFLKERIKNG